MLIRQKESRPYLHLHKCQNLQISIYKISIRLVSIDLVSLYVSICAGFICCGHIFPHSILIHQVFFSFFSYLYCYGPCALNSLILPLFSSASGSRHVHSSRSQSTPNWMTCHTCRYTLGDGHMSKTNAVPDYTMRLWALESLTLGKGENSVWKTDCNYLVCCCVLLQYKLYK